MYCHFCQTFKDVEENIFSLFQRRTVVCDSCIERLSKKPGQRCQRCQQFTDKDVKICEDCVMLNRVFDYVPDHIYTCMDYNDDVKALFHRYKFVNDAALAYVIAHFIRVNFRHYDVVVPVPISTQRLAERTYNQTTLVLDVLKVDYTSCLITDKVKRQSERTKYERLRVASPFTFASDMNKSTVQGKHVLLVDDIYTTGITASQATQVIRAAGALSVSVLAFSRS